MYSIIFRTIVMFFLVMIAVRLMGKKNLGEFQPSDLVATILISNLTSIVIESPDMPVAYYLIPILLITCFEVFMSVAVRKSSRLSKLAQGKAMILIKSGVINQKVMNELRFAVDDILEAMRGKDIFYLEEVAIALVETTGAVSIYPVPDSRNIQKADIPPFPVICDGEIMEENLALEGIDISFIHNILKKENVSLEKVLLLLVDGNKKYNLTVKE